MDNGQFKINVCESITRISIILSMCLIFGVGFVQMQNSIGAIGLIELQQAVIDCLLFALLFAVTGFLAELLKDYFIEGD